MVKVLLLLVVLSSNVALADVPIGLPPSESLELWRGPLSRAGLRPVGMDEGPWVVLVPGSQKWLVRGWDIDGGVYEETFATPRTDRDRETIAAVAGSLIFAWDIPTWDSANINLEANKPRPEPVTEEEPTHKVTAEVQEPPDKEEVLGMVPPKEPRTESILMVSENLEIPSLIPPPSQRPVAPYVAAYFGGHWHEKAKAGIAMELNAGVSWKGQLRGGARFSVGFAQRLTSTALGNRRVIPLEGGVQVTWTPLPGRVHPLAMTGLGMGTRRFLQDGGACTC